MNRLWIWVALFASVAPACGGSQDASGSGSAGASSSGSEGGLEATETTPGADTTSTGAGSESSASSSDSSSSSSSSSSSGDDGGALIEERPYELIVPDDYDPGTPTPLVLTLHGYGATGPLQSVYFRFTQDAPTRGYLVALPNGLLDGGGRRFWNATDACCDFEGQAVDDVAYLGAVLDDVVDRYNVDLGRIYVVGHSNGGFMAHRLACEMGDRIAAIVSLAGAMWADATACPGESLVNVLQIHGTADDTIAYGGGSTGAASYPSAPQTVEDWAVNNGCGGALEDVGTADLESTLDGEETVQARYADCPEGGDVGLWTIEAGGHIPALSDGWIDTLWAYLDAHPKP